MKVITLDTYKFKKKCIDLGNTIANSRWKPDLVIGVLTGGAYVSRHLIENDFFNGVQYNEIKIQRSSTQTKSNFSVERYLKHLPYGFLDCLRKIETIYREKRHESISLHNNVELIDLTFMEHQIQNSKKILIIDDAIDSGKTINTLKQNLLRVNSSLEIKTAVLTVTYNNPVILPEYCLNTRVLFRFPWSNDYKGLDKL